VNGAVEIHSYRRVFDLERRIYSVDRLRLNPGGVPVRGVLYFLVLLAASLLVSAVPILGGICTHVPWYLRELALPGLAATFASAIRLEGRAFHLVAHSLVRYWCGPRRLASMRRSQRIGSRWHPPDILMLPDGSDSCMRALRYRGPGAVLVCVEHERRGAKELGASALARLRLRSTLTLSQSPATRALAAGEVIALASGARLRIRSSGRRG
jgi:hypothetical protein